MATRKTPLALAGEVVFYMAAYFVCLIVFGAALRWLAGDFFGLTAAGFASAMMANWLALRYFAGGGFGAIGLQWNRSSADNLAYGLLGGIGAACLTLGPALAVGAAHFQTIPGGHFAIDGAAVLIVLLALGSAGEEILFRGYAFQALLARNGPWATIIPVAAVFGLVHWANPGATWLSIGNTVGFGVVLGYAYWRSRDLWLPIGLHFGWNFTLPLFGVNLSGLRIRMTGYELSWTAGGTWSGGDYGPEAGLLASMVVVLLFLYVWKAPIHGQLPAITGSPAESSTCESSPLSQS